MSIYLWVIKTPVTFGISPLGFYGLQMEESMDPIPAQERTSGEVQSAVADRRGVWGKPAIDGY